MSCLKELPITDRPRERLIKYGSNELSNIELLAILLKTGTKEEPVTTLAMKLLKEVGTISNFKTITLAKLMKIKGIKTAKACEILAMIELGKRIYLVPEPKDKIVCNNAKRIYEEHKHLFYEKKQEYFYCLYLNSKKELIERRLLFMGTLNRSLVHPREIFKEAYLLSASSIVCMHNHPSGDITPSKEDVLFTESLSSIGKLQQIPVVDHIIFGEDTYYSFYEHNGMWRNL